MTNVENRPEPGAVRLYDFRRPERLTGPLRDAFGNVQSRVAEAVGLSLSDELNREIAVAFQESAEETARTLLAGEYDAAYAIRAGDKTEGVLLLLEAPLTQAFVEMFLGGPGAPRAVERPPTAIEKVLLEKIAGRIGGSILAGGKPSAPAAVLLLDEEAREERGGVAGATARFEIPLGEEGGSFRLFYTYDNLASLFGLNPGAVETAAAGSERITREHVGGVPIRVRARLRSTPVRIGDITSLRVGDVLSLDRPITDPVEIWIGGRPAYLGHPGRVQENIGVRIAGEA